MDYIVDSTCAKLKTYTDAVSTYRRQGASSGNSTSTTRGGDNRERDNAGDSSFEKFRLRSLHRLAPTAAAAQASFQVVEFVLSNLDRDVVALIADGDDELNSKTAGIGASVGMTGNNDNDDDVAGHTAQLLSDLAVSALDALDAMVASGLLGQRPSDDVTSSGSDTTRSVASHIGMHAGGPASGGEVLHRLVRSVLRTLQELTCRISPPPPLSDWCGVTMASGSSVLSIEFLENIYGVAYGDFVELRKKQLSKSTLPQQATGIAVGSSEGSVGGKESLDENRASSGGGIMPLAMDVFCYIHRYQQTVKSVLGELDSSTPTSAEPFQMHNDESTAANNREGEEGDDDNAASVDISDIHLYSNTFWSGTRGAARSGGTASLSRGTQLLVLILRRCSSMWPVASLDYQVFFSYWFLYFFLLFFFLYAQHLQSIVVLPVSPVVCCDDVS